jgi:hypothetical protein
VRCVRRVVVFGEEAGAVGGEYEEGVDLGRRSGAVSVSWDEAERARTEKRERLGDMVGDYGCRWWVDRRCCFWRGEL